MNIRKNLISFILAAFLALIFISYAFFIVRSSNANLSQYFSFSKDEETFVFFGETYYTNKDLLYAADRYFSVCKEMNSVIFPKILRIPLKKAAVSVGTSAYEIISGFHSVINDLIYGNM